MDELFITILNMSITGAFVVAAICLARLPIKKAPKIISYSLWAVAGFRFAFPLSIESAYSLIPFSARTISADIALLPASRLDSGTPLLSNTIINASPPITYADTIANPLHGWAAIASWVWLAGVAVMLVLGIACYARLKHKMGSAIRVEGDLYETDIIRSPFVLGVFKPKIYIPLGLAGREREYIVAHERSHIRRYDHIIKSAAYFIVCLHWFNPLAWASFRLMSLDMEMSCDERVLKELGGGINKDYSMSLLSLAAGRRITGVSAIAFGEDGVKARIKNVLKLKKTSRIAVVLAVAFVVVLSIALMVSRAGTGDWTQMQAVITENIGSGLDNRLDNGHDNVLNNNNDPYYINGAAPDGASAQRTNINAPVSGNATTNGASAKRTYVITDYYNNDNGKFSALGLALDEGSSEKALTVSSGDILVTGARRYEVTAESLTLPFYTQPSIDQVVRWWTDCLDSWAQSGKVAAMN